MKQLFILFHICPEHQPFSLLVYCGSASAGYWQLFLQSKARLRYRSGFSLERRRVMLPLICCQSRKNLQAHSPPHSAQQIYLGGQAQNQKQWHSKQSVNGGSIVQAQISYSSCRSFSEVKGQAVFSACLMSVMLHHAERKCEQIKKGWGRWENVQEQSKNKGRSLRKWQIQYKLFNF